MDQIKNGTKLKNSRKAAGLTQKQVSEASGISLPNIKKYEIGNRDINIARVDIVKKLASAIGCSMEDILDY